jgi:hypothetical protein
MLANVKDNLNVFMCGEDNPKCSNCGQPRMASSKDCQNFIREKEIQKIKSEKNISYPEARRFVSAANDSPAQTSYAGVTKRVFNSVETQAMFTWIENTEKPTRLTGKPKERFVATSHKISSFSQTVTTSVKTSISSTMKTNVNNKTSKSQLSKGPPQGHGQLIKNPVQVHNIYGYRYLDDSEEASVWNLPPDDSPSPMDESPSETHRSPKGGGRKGKQRKKNFSPIRHP